MHCKCSAVPHAVTRVHSLLVVTAKNSSGNLWANAEALQSIQDSRRWGSGGLTVTTSFWYHGKFQLKNGELYK